MAITLNPDQIKAVGSLIDGFNKREHHGFTLTGEGGTGKTTCVMDAVKQWVADGQRVLLAAPTNKAVKQMEKAAAPFRFPEGKVEACTLAHALGLALLPSGEEKKIKKVGPCIIDQFNVLVMDESSMVSKYALFERILPAVEKAGVYLVVVGDTWQLPPVREHKSEAFDLYPGIALTTVERFGKDSPIATLTHGLRGSLIADRPYSFNSDEVGVETVLPVDFVKAVVSSFGEDVNNTRALAWTNSKVDTINGAVRQSIYGPQAAKFEVGERVVTGAPIFDELTDELVLGTDEECIVKAMTESSVHDEHGGRDYETYQLVLDPVYAAAGSIHCHVIHDRSVRQFNRDLDSIRERAGRDHREWFWFHKLKDLFADIRYSYCITVHRSQGSTFDTVLVDVPNILRNKSRSERNRLLYVACSRASKRLVLGSRKFVS